MTGNTCPSCAGAPPRKGQLLCKTCWFSVPKALQNKVWSTWKAFRAISKAYGCRMTEEKQAEYFTALKAYRAAADDATNAAKRALGLPEVAQ